MTSPSPGRKPIKIFVILIAGFLLLLSLIWCGIFLYWDWTLRKEIRDWEAKFVPLESGDSSFDIIALGSVPTQAPRAGCRALPYLVDAMNSSGNPQFQDAVMNLIQGILLGPIPRGAGGSNSLPDPTRWVYKNGKRTLDRNQFLTDFNEWWRVNGARYHQGWRVWSSWCPGN
ncbi:MAG TPA: hypothetical protein VE981_03295 [Planctomycetota bacterium]|nr:hypothetical protein [Planctomycetota bacterium]